MNRPAFLTSPGSWVRAARIAQTPAEYATAIEHHRSGTPGERVAGVVIAVVLGILGAAALAHWWAS